MFLMNPKVWIQPTSKFNFRLDKIRKSVTIYSIPVKLDLFELNLLNL
ncbi:hypothetical protein ACJIZ3_000121 [Penstemon smallii]|uniref:Uncharacterized protein n=1 Tax=Penstemon smallii TaxID=265156 RepID=A0ABD3R9L8_9LAMI